MHKILFVLHYPPPIHGAAMVGDYVRKSSKINSTFNSKFINLSTSQELGEIGKGGYAKLWRFPKILIAVYRNLIHFKPDLVYVTLSTGGIGFLKDALIVLLVKLFSTKIVYHLHNTGVSKYQHKPVYNFFYKKVFKNATVILLSKHLIKDVSKYVDKENIRICANGLPNINQKGNVNAKPKNKIIRILFLSNLIEEKGVYVLLKACQILKQNSVPFSCAFVGNESDISKEDLLSQIKILDLDDHVEYLGPKFGDDKYEEYFKADIFAFPTYYNKETFGLVNIEAMQFSLPIISTAIGGIPDVVENNVAGFLVETNNSKEVAEKLNTLIMNPKLRLEMGQKGYNNYTEKFTLAIFEKRLIAILEELI